MSGAFIVMWAAVAVIAVLGIAVILVAMSFEDEHPGDDATTKEGR